MKKSKPFLELLKHMEQTGRLPHWYVGLCYYVFYEVNAAEQTIFEYLTPTEEDRRMLKKEGKDADFWGSDDASLLPYEATDLRKTIIAFCAAINNEL